jgi:hypothetical protein
MPTLLTVNFSLEQFERASKGPLTPAGKVNADTFARTLLQPLRRAMGYPVIITSFYRPGD